MVSNNNAAGDDDTDLNWKKKMYTVIWNVILSILSSQMDFNTRKWFFVHQYSAKKNQNKLFWWVFSVQTGMSLNH